MDGVRRQEVELFFFEVRQEDGLGICFVCMCAWWWEGKGNKGSPSRKKCFILMVSGKGSQEG